MKFSKLIPLSIVSLLAAGGLTGCNGGAENPNEIIVWATSAEEPVINALLESYNGTVEEGEKLSVKYVAIAEGDVGTELAKDSTSKTAADLFLVVDDHIYDMIGKRIVLDMTESPYASSVKSRNETAAVKGASYDNHLYGFPVTNDNGYFLYYNTDIIPDAKAGKLEDILATLADKTKSLLFTPNNGYYAATFFLSPQVGGTDSLNFYENSDGDVLYNINWDDNKGVAAFDAARALFTTYEETFTSASNDTVIAKMKDKTAGAAIFGPHVYNSIKEELGNKLKVTKLPTFKVGSTNAQMASFSGSKVYCINGAKQMSSDKKGRVAKFADYITGKAGQLKRFQVRGTIPCNKEALQDSSYTKTAVAEALEAQKPYAAVQAVAAQGRYWSVGEAIGTAIKDGLPTGKTTKQFLKGQCDSLRQVG